VDDAGERSVVAGRVRAIAARGLVAIACGGRVAIVCGGRVAIVCGGLAVAHGRHAVTRRIATRLALGLGHVVVGEPVANPGVDVASCGGPVARAALVPAASLAHGAKRIAPVPPQ
jgi:hypothetical protein